MRSSAAIWHGVSVLVTAVVYPAVLLGFLSLLPLLPPWLFPGAAAAYWESHAISVWPFLLVGAFVAGWAGVLLLNRRRTERIPPPFGALVGSLIGVIGTLLGTGIVTPVLESVQHLLPDYPEGTSWPTGMFLRGYGVSYIIPAAVGGLLAAVRFRKQAAT